MIVVMVISAAVMMAGGAAFFRSISALYFATGVALMCAVNIAKIFLIRRAIRLTLEHENSKDGKNVARLQYLLRFAFTGVVFLVVILITRQTGDFAAILGGLIGVLTLLIGTMSLKFMNLEQPQEALQPQAPQEPQEESVKESIEEEGGNSEL